MQATALPNAFSVVGCSWLRLAVSMTSRASYLRKSLFLPSARHTYSVKACSSTLFYTLEIMMACVVQFMSAWHTTSVLLVLPQSLDAVWFLHLPLNFSFSVPACVFQTLQRLKHLTSTHTNFSMCLPLFLNVRFCEKNAQLLSTYE